MGALLQNEADARITAAEYEQMTAGMEKRMELLDGVIVAMGAPSREHQRIAGHLFRTIEDFIQAHHGTCTVDQGAEALLNEYTLVIPDVMVVCDPSKLDSQRCNGVPDWIIEILSTNRRTDLIDKLHLYHEAGVREYWIVDPKKRVTLVYCFEQNDFPDMYTFDTPIPVGIYDKALTILMEDLA
ncbi:MAG: Uma2 family endonuclease [Oscillospiraceae bacterium]|nr:Uma2 family endonuclease [Oscillospiraceae bacterium]